MGKCKTILLAGMLLFLLGTGLWVSKIQTTADADYTGEIKRLKQQNDSLAISNQLLDRKVERLRLRSDSLTQIAREKRRVIIEFKKEKHEKIKAIDHYSDDKLFRFFAKLKTDTASTER